MQTIDEEDINLENALDSLNYKYEAFKPKILVFGVGGGGVNAVNSMVGSDLNDVDFVVANTDYQSLQCSPIKKKVLLGKQTTSGMGAGADPIIGKNAAEESLDEIEKILNNASMVFITAGMGGGTGTGATPVIAKKAKELGILVAAIVTKPFISEGTQKMRQAETGIEELKKYVDTLIIVPNQNLFKLANQDTKMQDSLKMVDNVLKSGVKGITDLITKAGFINLDFADVKTIMKKMGKAMMGTGEATGENKAIKAVEEAISNPLLDNVSIKGAKGVIINITGSPDITLFEYEDATKRIKEEVGNEYADIIIGNVFDNTMEDTMRVSIFATGISDEENKNIEENEDISEEIDNDIIFKNDIENKSEIQEKYDIKEEIVEDFFDMGETLKYEEPIKIRDVKQNKQQINKHDIQQQFIKNNAKIDKNYRNNYQEDKNTKKGFFSTLFGGSKKEQEINIVSNIIDDDDMQINIDMYNTPAYLRKRNNNNE